MHYTAGFGSFTFIAASIALPPLDDPLILAARVLLDVAGTVFGMYLLGFLIILFWPANRRPSTGRAMDRTITLADVEPTADGSAALPTAR